MNELTKELAKLDGEEVAGLYKKVFSTAEGKLVLQDLKNRAFFYQSTADDNSHKTYFREGIRASVLHIESQIDFEPEQKGLINGDSTPNPA